ncbi:hypothetical protein D3C87_475610 [compost metagenome]
MASGFLTVSLISHGILVLAFLDRPELARDKFGKGLATYCAIMTVWAAGLLLQPTI